MEDCPPIDTFWVEVSLACDFRGEFFFEILTIRNQIFYLIRIKWSIFQEDIPYIIPANFGTNAYTVIGIKT
jgi:hypothetical protein